MAAAIFKQVTEQYPAHYQMSSDYFTKKKSGILTIVYASMHNGAEEALNQQSKQP